MEVGINNYQGFPDRLHNGLSIGSRCLCGLLRPPPLGNVAKDQYDACEPSVVVADRGATVVDGSFRAIPGEQQCVVGQSKDHAGW